MAAGLGFKDFTTGEVLTAADVDGYLMQGIWVFASAAARDAAVTSPQEGNFAFTKDTNGLWYYDGAAWVASGATGDIEGVTAGIGISGGGTSGTVTITNSMATAIDAKGDLIVGTGADTFSRLAVGATAGHVLTVDSAEATGMKWAAAGGGGGITLLSTTTLSGATTTISSIDQTYKNLYAIVYGVTNATANGKLNIRPNGATTSVNQIITQNTTPPSFNTFGGDYFYLNGNDLTRTDSNNNWWVSFPDYASSSHFKTMTSYGASTNGTYPWFTTGCYYSNTAISSLVFHNTGGSLSTGTVLLYGEK